MRPLVLFLLAAVGAGCAGSAPPVVPLPVPPVERAAPPPLAEPVAVEVETVQAPVTPPPTPERRIARRSVYEEVQATEWELENGLTVVYVQRPIVGYHAHVTAPTGWRGLPESERAAFAQIGEGRWGPLVGRLGPGERVATGSAETLGDVVDAVRALLTAAPDAVAPFDALAQASPRWGGVQPEARADDGASRLAQAFGQPQAFTVVVVGALGPEWVEPIVAERLFMRRGGGPLFDAAEPTGDGSVPGAGRGRVAEWDVAGGWDDLATVLVLDAVLSARANGPQRAAVAFDAGRGTIRLRVSTSGPELDLWAPISAAEADEGRRRAAVEAEAAAGQARAFADLWALSGRFRPARNPVDAAALPAAIARTPSGRVDDLLRRLLASPRTARLGSLTPSSDIP